MPLVVISFVSQKNDLPFVKGWCPLSTFVVQKCQSVTKLGGRLGRRPVSHTPQWPAASIGQSSTQSLTLEHFTVVAVIRVYHQTFSSLTPSQHNFISQHKMMDSNVIGEMVIGCVTPSGNRCKMGENLRI